MKKRRTGEFGFCILKNCSNHTKKSVLTRGLCMRCYQSARRAIQSKKTTWAELEKAGLANRHKYEKAFDTALATHNK